MRVGLGAKTTGVVCLYDGCPGAWAGAACWCRQDAFPICHIARHVARRAPSAEVREPQGVRAHGTALMPVIRGRWPAGRRRHSQAVHRDERCQAFLLLLYQRARSRPRLIQLCSCRGSCQRPGTHAVLLLPQDKVEPYVEAAKRLYKELVR